MSVKFYKTTGGIFADADKNRLIMADTTEFVLKSDYDELTRQNKILRDQRNYQIKQNTDSAEQYARLVAHEDEALKSCGGGES